MFTTILIASLATAPMTAPAPVRHAQTLTFTPIPNYRIVNQIANPGFEEGMSDWFSSNSFVDPNWYGDPKQYQPLFTEGVTSSLRRSGNLGFQFGLQSEYGYGKAYIFSEVHQTLVNPVNVDSLASASFYAFSQATNWGPQTVTVKVEYADASPSTYSQGITGYYGSGGVQASGWTKVDFKGSLRTGKTITRLTIFTERYPYGAENLWIDDVTLGKKVPLVFLPRP